MLPRKMKKMNVFADGVSYAGEATEVDLPELSRKLEEYRGGGMMGPVQIDFGQEEIVLTHKYGGYMPELGRTYGSPKLDAAQIRFVGAFQREDTGATEAVEIVVRGRHKKIGSGTQKVGDDTETEIETTCVYYKETVNGRVEKEIDILNSILIINGVDQEAALRAAAEI